MHLFLSKHSIQSLLKGQKSHLIAKKEQVERRKHIAILGSKEEAKRIIDKSKQKAEKTKKIIDKEINSQEKTLEARIKRRKSMSNRSTKTDNEDLCEDLFSKKGVPPSCNFVLEGLL